MPYSVNMVLFGVSPQSQVIGSGQKGFPTTFDFFLLSEWVCNGPGIAHRGIGVSDINPFFSVQATSDAGLAVNLQRQVSVPALVHTFAVNTTNVLTNILMSVQLSTNTLQLYVNDAPIVETLSWTNSGQFNIAGFFNSWDMTSAGSTGPGAAIGDLYLNAPATFYDLSVVANRRKFINANGTPVDPLADGSGPTGSQPPIFCTVRGASPATAFATNNGFGGSFTTSGTTLAFQTPGSCVMPIEQPFYLTKPTRER